MSRKYTYMVWILWKLFVCLSVCLFTANDCHKTMVPRQTITQDRKCYWRWLYIYVYGHFPFVNYGEKKKLEMRCDNTLHSLIHYCTCVSLQHKEFHIQHNSVFYCTRSLYYMRPLYRGSLYNMRSNYIHHYNYETFYVPWGFFFLYQVSTTHQFSLCTVFF